MLPPAHDRLTVISVCHNSTDVVPDMLASLPNGVLCVLVANGGDDHDTLTQLSERHGARLITSKTNMGFGRACNLGARGVDTEFLLFLHPDAILETDALTTLVLGADAHPDASAFIPRLIGADGRPLWQMPTELLRSSDQMPETEPIADCEIPSVTSAALLVRRSAFQKIGGFDPQIFLFHEDAELSLRLRQSCGPLVFLRIPVVRHFAGTSSRHSPEGAISKAYQSGRSLVYARQKHGHPRPFLSALGTTLKRRLVSRDKQEKEQIKAMLSGIWSTRKDGGRYIPDLDPTDSEL